MYIQIVAAQWHHMAPWVFANIYSGDGLLPDDIRYYLKKC